MSYLSKIFVELAGISYKWTILAPDFVVFCPCDPLTGVFVVLTTLITCRYYRLSSSGPKNYYLEDSSSSDYYLSATLLLSVFDRCAETGALSVFSFGSVTPERGL